jgi:hypothetical protein
MVDVVLDTEDITVLGGPSNISLDIDIGPPGERGTFVMYGIENPNEKDINTFVDIPKIFDLYVLVNPLSDDYLTIFSYQTQDGRDLWVPALKLTPNFFATNKVLEFTDGVAETRINLFDLGIANVQYPTYVNSAALFNVQVTLSNFNVLEIPDPITNPPLPAAVSVFVKDLEELEDGLLEIPIVITAAELNPLSGWGAIDNKTVIGHLSVTVVSPTEVFNLLSGGEES